MNLRVDFPPWHQCHLQYLRLTKTDRELTQKLQKAKQKHCLAFVFGQTRCIICSKWNWKILNILTTILAVVLSSRKQNAYSQICCRQPCWNIVSPISTSPSRLKSSSFWGSRTQSVMLWKSPHESAISFFFYPKFTPEIFSQNQLRPGCPNREWRPAPPYGCMNV